MTKTTLAVATTLLILSTKSFCSHIDSSNEASTEPSTYQRVLSIKELRKSNQITAKTAIRRLFKLGYDLSKQGDGIADIIDTLGDLGAINEGYILCYLHNL